MAGCILFKSDLTSRSKYSSYNVTDRQRHNTYTIDANGVMQQTDVVLNRTVIHDRIGSHWMDYLERFTDDGPRIRKIKIQLDKIRDHDDRCWEFD